MSTSITFNGTSYTVPAIGDASWGTNVSNYLIAIASGCLQKSGGSFTLTAEVDFGATYGLKTQYLKTKTTNVASAGWARLAKTDTIDWRNNTNGGDLALGINGSDAIQFNSIALVDLSSSQTLTNKSMSGSSNTFTNLPATGLTGIVPPANGGTGVANNSASTITISGSFASTFTITGITTLTLPTSGTVAVTSNKLSVFAATTSAELAGVISDETGSGALVFGTSPTIGTASLTSPTMTTPTLGVATATSINKMAITAPATSSTLAVADGKTFTASNTLTLAGTDGNTLTFPSGSATVMTVTGTQSPTNKTFDNTNSLTIKVGNLTLEDGTDTTKQAVFSLSGMTTAKTLTLASAATNSRTVTFPDATDTLVGKATTDTLTNKTLTGNTAVNLISGSGTLTLNTTGTVTLPNATDTLVGKATTDTLTNKTLTSPTVTGESSTAIAALGLRDTSAAFDVTLAATSSTTISAGRTITIDVQNASKTIKITPLSNFSTLSDGTAGQILSTLGTNTGYSWASALSTTLNQYNTFIGDATNTGTATNTNLLGSVKAATASSTVTISQASPGVVSWSSNGLANGDTVYFTTSGSLPTGLTASTTYYVVSVATNTFQVSATYGGTAINTSSAGSGTHTAFAGGLTLKTTVGPAVNFVNGVQIGGGGTITTFTDWTDYSGSFVVKIGSGTLTLNTHYSVGVARYMKIGKQVTLYFRMTLSSFNSNTGSLYIGVPITAASGVQTPAINGTVLHQQQTDSKTYPGFVYFGGGDTNGFQIWTTRTGNGTTGIVSILATTNGLTAADLIHGATLTYEAAT